MRAAPLLKNARKSHWNLVRAPIIFLLFISVCHRAKKWPKVVYSHSHFAFARRLWKGIKTTLRNQSPKRMRKKRERCQLGQSLMKKTKTFLKVLFVSYMRSLEAPPKNLRLRPLERS